MRNGRGSEAGNERGGEAERTKKLEKEGGSEAARRKEERVSIGEVVLDEAGGKQHNITQRRRIILKSSENRFFGDSSYTLVLAVDDSHCERDERACYT